MVKLYNPLNSFTFSGRKFYIFLHVAVWIILFILPTYLMYTDSGNDMSFLYRTYVQILLYAIIFYANYLWLSPKLFFRKKKIYYFIAALSLVAVSTYVNEIAFRKFDAGRQPVQKMRPIPNSLQHPPGILFRPDFAPPDNHKRPLKNWPVYNFVITTLFLSGFGMGLSFSDKLRQHERERKEAEKEKLNTELAFLKNQINPHFFFNTLNNIYSLVQTDVSDGQKAILQLSKLMRYLLYETDKGNILLSQEIEFMRTYIELMKLRISEKVTFTLSFPEDYSDVPIPPLIFLPFIENAFKHGISYRRSSFIDVSLDVVPGKIIFECANSINKADETLLRSEPGIGLENVKKRLALLFPGKYDLKIAENEDSFRISLKIDIS